jgi:hypothetical protein
MMTHIAHIADRDAISRDALPTQSAAHDWLHKMRAPCA